MYVLFLLRESKWKFRKCIIAQSLPNQLGEEREEDRMLHSFSRNAIHCFPSTLYLNAKPWHVQSHFSHVISVIMGRCLWQKSTL